MPNRILTEDTKTALTESENKSMKNIIKMLFNLQMFVSYGSVYVDENYSALLEPILYGDSPFQPGVTYTDMYQGDAGAGAVKIYKSTDDGAATPGTPGRDFTDEEGTNTLISLLLNNNYQKSKKIYQVKANAVSYDLAAENLDMAIQNTRKGKDISACACLANEGTDYADYTAITKSNVKEYIINMRKSLRDAGANADVIQCSTAVYATMLDAAGDEFTPMRNDSIQSSGQIGSWLGFTIVENNLLNNEQAKYYDYAGTLQTVDLTDIDMIMYDHMAFHIVDNLEMMRVIDSERFTGSLAQVELNMGFRVSNSARVAVKKNLLLDVLTVVSVDGTDSGDTALTVTPDLLTGNSYVYKTDDTTAPTVTFLQDLSTWTAWDGVSEIAGLTDGHKITVAEVNASDLAIKAGNTTLNVKA